MGSKIGVVDVGGGYRGVYATGVLDYCLEHNIMFDLGIGVSAGSANVISYAAKQARRNYRFYVKYGLRKEYAGVGNFISKKSFIDMDYVYGTLSNSDGEDPLDYHAFSESPMEFVAVATEAESGKVRYFYNRDIKKDSYDVLKASCAIPFVCHPYSVDGIPCYDGALGDPVPIEKAFQMGCDKVVLLLTLPENTIRTPKKDLRLAKGIRKKYPLAAKALEQRAQRYNEGVALARDYAAQGKLLIVAPDDTCGVSTLKRNPENLRKLYEKGYQDGERIAAFIQA